MTPRRWAFAVAMVLALSLAYDVARIPVQVSDSVNDLLEAQLPPSAAAAFTGALHDRQFLRPLKIAQTRIVNDASGGRYTLAYRGIHVLLLVLAVWLFTRALQVRTDVDLAAAVFALTVLLGLHTFANVLREAYPVNHFLEVIVFALATLNLALGRPSVLSDAAAAVLLLAGALIVESGLLIWVVAVAARVSGMRGVSWKGIAAMTLLVLGYVYVRVAVFSTGVPTIDERSSGFLLGVLEPGELAQRFGQYPLVFYTYNVTAAVFTVVFAEPRAGLLAATKAWLDGELPPWTAVAVATSAITTALIIAGAILGWRRRAEREDADRFFVICAAVLLANAVVSFAYLKDEIMSLAGVCYALAAYAFLRRLIPAAQSANRAVLSAVCIVLVIASTGWAVRTSGVHYALRNTAFKTRNDWAAVQERWNLTPETQAIAARLRADALERRVVPPRFYPPWQARWFEE